MLSIPESPSSAHTLVCDRHFLFLLRDPSEDVGDLRELCLFSTLPWLHDSGSLDHHPDLSVSISEE